MTAPLILVATGGTAGHVVPALAVADALRANGADVHFVGGDRAEAELVPAAGYEFHQLNVVSLPRRSPLGAARAARSTPARWQAPPHWSRGCGRAPCSEVAAMSPVRSASPAPMLRTPLVIAEIDGHLGLTNRLLAPLARRVCTALPLPGHTAPKFVITGRPIPPVPTDREAARARFGVGPEETLVLVFGGSQGARSINQAALAAFAETEFPGAARGGRARPAGPAGPETRLRPARLHLGTHGCDRRLRPGRGALGRLDLGARGGRPPSVLIPYPYATADHQTVNARYLADAGAAVLIPDSELTHERLRTEVEALLADPQRLDAMGRAALGLARPHAAAVIASEVLAAAGVQSIVAARPAGELEA